MRAFRPVSVHQSWRRRPAVRTSALAVSVASLALLLSAPARAQVVQNDFEDGTLQGWTARGGGVVLTNSTVVAHGGTHSLLTTGRTAGFHGPSLNILSTLTKGATLSGGEVTCSANIAPLRC